MMQLNQTMRQRERRWWREGGEIGKVYIKLIAGSHWFIDEIMNWILMYELEPISRGEAWSGESWRGVLGGHHYLDGHCKLLNKHVLLVGCMAFLQGRGYIGELGDNRG